MTSIGSWMMILGIAAIVGSIFIHFNAKDLIDSYFSSLLLVVGPLLLIMASIFIVGGRIEEAVKNGPSK